MPLHLTFSSHPPELCPLFSSYHIRQIISISKEDIRIVQGRQAYSEKRSQYDVFFRRGWRNLRFSAKHPSDICPLNATIPTSSRPDNTSYLIPVGGNYSDNRIIRIAHPVRAGGTCSSKILEFHYSHVLCFPGCLACTVVYRFVPFSSLSKGLTFDPDHSLQFAVRSKSLCFGRMTHFSHPCPRRACNLPP